MSLDMGAGTLVSAANLAWSIYKSCKAAPGSFENISSEVLSLNALLTQVGETLSGHKLSTSTQQRLDAIVNACQATLDDLESLVKQYESLATKRKRNWDRLNWSENQVSLLRSRLISNVTMLSAFLNTSQPIIEQKIKQLIREVQAGEHEGSVLSSVDSLAEDDEDLWRVVRKELEENGISVVAFDANKEFIIKQLSEAIRSGAFEEQISVTPPHETDPHVLLIDQDQGSESLTEAVNKVPDQDLDTYADSGSKPSLDHSEEQSSVKYKPSSKRTPRLISTLFTRSLGYSNAFIEVCSPIDPTRAGKLLKKGADINATYTGNIISFRDDTAIGIATGRADKTAVSWLLDHGARIQLTKKPKFALLYRAVNGTAETPKDEKSVYIVVHLLMSHAGKDILSTLINETGPDGRTTLSKAAQMNYEGVVGRLLEGGADYNAQCQKGWTPLMYAAEGGFDGIVRILLECGADIRRASRGGRSALYIAVKEGQTSTVLLLLNHGADAKCAVRDESALGIAVKLGHTAIVKLLLGHGANAKDTFQGQPLLLVAAKISKMEIVSLLIQVGALDNKALGRSLLHATIASSSPDGSEVLKLVLSYGIHVTPSDFEMALKFSKVEIATLLVQAGALDSLNRQTGRSLWKAVIASRDRGGKEFVKPMLDHGARVDWVDDEGKTALRYAVEEQDVNSVRLLLDHGARSNQVWPMKKKHQKNVSLNKPLLRIAIEQSQTEIAKLLIEKRAEVDGLLRLALESKQNEIAKLMIEQGVWVNGINVDEGKGESTLHLAIQNSSPDNKLERDVVYLIIDRGANLLAKNALGRTALDVAVGQHDMKLAKYLLDKGAINNPGLYAALGSGEYATEDLLQIKSGYEILTSQLTFEQ